MTKEPHGAREADQLSSKNLCFKRDLEGGASTSREAESSMYGRVYGMQKTTVYLPEDLKASLERVALETERSVAEIIREALRKAVDESRKPRPRVPLTGEGLGDPTAALRVDELLREGFGRT